MKKENKPREKYSLSCQKYFITAEDIGSYPSGYNHVIWNFGLTETRRIREFMKAINAVYPEKFCEKELIEFGQLLLQYSPYSAVQAICAIRNLVFG
jgi:hypothetical protein